jgi:carbamoylphosphate synthase large subunit
LSQFDDSIKPKTLLWLSSVAHEKIIEHMKDIGIDFPCIVKADISRRSQKIRIVFSEEELKELSML